MAFSCSEPSSGSARKLGPVKGTGLDWRGAGGGGAEQGERAGQRGDPLTRKDGMGTGMCLRGLGFPQPSPGVPLGWQGPS